MELQPHFSLHGHRVFVSTMLTVLVAAIFLVGSGANPTSRHDQQYDFPAKLIGSLAEKVSSLTSLSKISKEDKGLCQYNISESATLTMLDASGKPGSNLMSITYTGVVQWLGDYDECMSISHDVAQYCLFQGQNGHLSSSLADGKNVTLVLVRWGLCVPRQCNASSVKADVINALRSIVTYDLSDVTVTCQDGRHTFTPFAVFVIVLCCIIGMVVCVATVVDYSRHCVEKTLRLAYATAIPDDFLNDSHEDSSLLGKDPMVSNAKSKHEGVKVLHEVLLSFSLVRNISKLLDTSSNAKNVSCLHGIRTISMTWVILGHCYVFFVMVVFVVNFKDGYDLPLDFAFQPIGNAYFSVDSFFFLSGLLVMYLSLQQLEATKGHFPWIKYYVHRFWRLTPTFAVALLFYWQLTPYLADGPIWKNAFKAQQEYCDKSWWSTLFYFNNFYPEFGKTCMGWTWYLAADTQMYIFGPLFILPAYFFGILGLIPVALALVLVITTIAIVSAVKEFPANVISLRRSPSGGSGDDYHDMIYDKFYTRAGPYLVGMAVGYYLAKQDNLKEKAFKLWAIIGWIVAIALGMTLVYGLYGYNHGDHYSQGASSLYLMFKSALWGVCLAWVVYACSTGNGGIVDSILSWPVWFPLSRLTYSAYLLHPAVIVVYIASLRQPIFIDNFHMAYLFVSVTVLSYGCAAILSLCVEYPMAALEKIILKMFRRKSTV